MQPLKKRAEAADQFNTVFNLLVETREALENDQENFYDRILNLKNAVHQIKLPSINGVTVTPGPESLHALHILRSLHETLEALDQEVTVTDKVSAIDGNEANAEIASIIAVVDSYIDEIVGIDSSLALGLDAAEQDISVKDRRQQIIAEYIDKVKQDLAAEDQAEAETDKQLDDLKRQLHER